MRTVNRYFLGLITDDITGMGDDDSVQDKYPDLDPDNKDHVIHFILNEMKTVNDLTASAKEILNNTLIYYCYFYTDAFDWESDFYSMLPPFSPPRDALDFYRWYFEAFFGDVDLKSIERSAFIEVEDTSIFDRRNKKWFAV